MQNNLKQKWSEIIEEQKLSGKSVIDWCRDQEVSYRSFLNWRKRLSKDQDKNPSFAETDEETWVEIHLEGAWIRITKNFDRSALLFCLKLLGGH